MIWYTSTSIKYEVFEYQQRGAQTAQVCSNMCIDYTSPTVVV
jgi:hypothetical protein